MSKLPTIEIDPGEMARAMSEAYEDLGPPAPSDEGLTVKEYAKLKGICRSTAQMRLKKLDEHGLLIKGQRYERRTDGSWQPKPVYRLKEVENETDAVV